MDLNQIVDVVITRQTRTVTEQGFGTPLIVGTHVNFPERVRYYSSMQDVAADFSSDEKEYIAAQDIFSQDISPNLIGIGRRQVDSVALKVETPMPNQDYTLKINNTDVTVSSISGATYGEVVLSSDLVTDNIINVSVNNTIVGTVKSRISFDSDFDSDSSIVATINGVALSPVVWNTDQPTTLSDLAAHIATNLDVATSVVSGPRSILVTFADAGNNTVNSVVSNGTLPEPIATIHEGGFIFDTSHLNTMNQIAIALSSLPGVQSATVSDPQNRTLTVMGFLGTTQNFSMFTINDGASQANVVISSQLQPITSEAIATLIVNAINTNLTLPVTATLGVQGEFLVTNKVSGTAYTLKASSDISNPNRARIEVTQVLPNSTYSVKINGIDFSYTAPSDIQTTSQVVSKLVDMINNPTQQIPPLTQVQVDAIDNGDGSFQLIAINPTMPFSIVVSPSNLSAEWGVYVTSLIAASTVTNDLDKIYDADKNWYALISVDHTPSIILEMAAWAQSHVVLFGASSSQLDIINIPAGSDNSSLAFQLMSQNYSRTFLMYHQDSAFDYPEAAWMGRVLPLVPGSETWSYKTLNNVSYSDLTTTQSNTAHNKNTNTYEFVGGVGITYPGKVASGEWIDVIRGIDWLTARIKEAVFSLFVNNPKVPYTDAGIASIQAAVMSVLNTGVANGLLTNDPAPIVRVPLARDVPSVDKNNRILKNVTFEATLQGAIHQVVIRGTISV